MLSRLGPNALCLVYVMLLINDDHHFSDRSPYLHVTSTDPLSRNSEALNQANIQKCCQRTRMRDWMRKMMRSMGILCVAPVGRAMLQMNSGSVATYVRSGFMENA